MIKKMFCSEHGWLNFVRGYDEYWQEVVWYCPLCSEENGENDDGQT